MMIRAQKFASATDGQAAVWRLMGLGAALVALVLLGSAALQARENRALVQGVVDRPLVRAVSDAADREIGSYFGNNRGLAGTMAVDAHDEPFYAWTGRARDDALALSANVMRHQIDEYMAAGMNGFVAKPIDMATLIGGIEDALAGADTQSAAA